MAFKCGVLLGSVVFSDSRRQPSSENTWRLAFHPLCRPDPLSNRVVSYTLLTDRSSGSVALVGVVSRWLPGLGGDTKCPAGDALLRLPVPAVAPAYDR